MGCADNDIVDLILICVLVLQTTQDLKSNMVFNTSNIGSHEDNAPVELSIGDDKRSRLLTNMNAFRNLVFSTKPPQLNSKCRAGNV